MNSSQKKRNYCIDFVKGIACIFVVFMHCEFPGTLGTLVQCIARFSVPFFFIVSGYFCYRKNGNYSYKEKIKHIALIVLSASLFYAIVTPLYTSGGPNFSLSKIAGFLIFNIPIYIAPQMWFLFALLYDYILFIIVEKIRLQKQAYLSIPILMSLYILMAQGAHLIGMNVPNALYRNFLIEGFPFFSLGYFLHASGRRIKASNKILISIVVITTMFCPVERALMGRDFGMNIMSFPQVISIFLLCIKNPSFGEKAVLTKLGTKYSMFVYIIHPAVWHLLEKGYDILRLNSNMAALYMLPVFCVLITVVLSVVFVSIKNTALISLKKRSV